MRIVTRAEYDERIAAYFAENPPRAGIAVYDGAVVLAEDEYVED